MPSDRLPLLLLPGFIAVLLARSSHAAAAEPAEPASEPAVIALRKVLPAVVNINTERVIRKTIQDPYDAFFYEFFGGAMRPPRELRQKVQSLGSGFLVDPAGFIVTNEHVVERAADLKIQVTTTDGKTYRARYVAGDEKTDLAFIKIESKTPLPFIDLDDLSPNLLGQTVLAVGDPLGYGSSVSRGILSALKRTITLNESEYKDLVQTDAAINPGNSGGPLIDLAGRLVGVSSVKMAYTPQGVPTQGLGFGIPAELVREKVVEFRRTAQQQEQQQATQGAAASPSAARTSFGLTLQDLTEELTETFGYEPGKGVLIADAEERSPAAKAGLRRGLAVYKVGRFDVKSVKQVESLLAKVTTGTEVDMLVGVIRRAGNQTQRHVETVTLIAR